MEVEFDPINRVPERIGVFPGPGLAGDHPDFVLRPFSLARVPRRGQNAAMPQLQLPVFPEGVTQLSTDLGVSCREGRVSYFYGTLPVFTHDAKDVKSFRMFVSQLYLEGKIKQAAVVRVFGVSPVSLKRAVKLFEKKGAGGFWEPRPTRGATVLTEAVLRQAQGLLDQGKTVAEVAAQLHLKVDTLQKAVRAGRLVVPLKKKRKVRPLRAPRPRPRR